MYYYLHTILTLGILSWKAYIRDKRSDDLFCIQTIQYTLSEEANTSCPYVAVVSIIICS